MDHELTILIPAFQEEPRIGAVLDIVCGFPYKKQVVVINDGSRDKTAERAQEFPVELISYKENKGKGAALQAGIKHVKESPFWLFLDADLINLKHDHLEALWEPLKENACQMTVGIFKDGYKHVDLVHHYFGILNGQRGFTGDFISNLPDISWSRFGIEIFLSRLAHKYGLPVVHPFLKGLSHHIKEVKYGYLPGLTSRLKMYRECLYALRNWEKHL